MNIFKRLFSRGRYKVNAGTPHINVPKPTVERVHPHLIPFVTFAVLIIFSGLTFGVYKLTHRSHIVVPDTKIVIVSHDGQKQVVPTRQATVGSLLAKLNIKLDEGDRVEPDVSTAINQDQFRVNVYRSVPVEVVDGTQHTFAFSAGTTPRSIATQSTGTHLYNEDDVSTEPSQDFLKTGVIGEQVVITRAVPVSLNLYGAPLMVRTHSATVADMIREKHIRLAKDDQVTPALNTPISANAQIIVARNGTKLETITEAIAMPVQSIPDPSLAYGTNAVRQAGAPGQRVTTYQDILRNGIVVGRTAIQSIVTEQPVTQIVAIGSSLSGIKGDMALAGIDPSDYQYVDYIVSHESGWCPTKAQGQYGGCPPYAGFVPAYGGYGLCQSTPGSKMASAGADWATNPVTQLRWCSGYAHGRYGSWAAAYSHWLAYHNW